MGKIAKNMPIYIEVRLKSLMRSASIGSIKTHKKSPKKFLEGLLICISNDKIDYYGLVCQIKLIMY